MHLAAGLLPKERDHKPLMSGRDVSEAPTNNGSPSRLSGRQEGKRGLSILVSVDARALFALALLLLHSLPACSSVRKAFIQCHRCCCLTQPVLRYITSSLLFRRPLLHRMARMLAKSMISAPMEDGRWEIRRRGISILHHLSEMVDEDGLHI